MELTKSCLNYTGGKYKLLPQLEPYFPNHIGVFYDIFCGGCNVSVNTLASEIICYDIVSEVIDLFNFIKDENIDSIITSINELANTYNLSITSEYGYEPYKSNNSDGLQEYNRLGYMTLRDNYNKKKYRNEQERNIWFFALVIFGFNNQIRFNKKKEFNIPVGKRDFNLKMREKLIKFSNKIKALEITFEKKDFRTIDIESINVEDFVYADPPYLISTASYNEQGGWSEDKEIELLNLLDRLNEKGVRFALSNVLESKGKENLILKEWAQKYTINYLNFNYNNSNYQIKDKNNATIEVLITNYKNNMN